MRCFSETIKFAISNFYCRGVSHKNSVVDDFPLCPQGPPLKNRKFYFYCRLAVSDLRGGEISIIGVCVRAPVAIINFGLLVRELLTASYINSEIFTRI